MRTATRWMAVLGVVLTAGCLEKPPSSVLEQGVSEEDRIGSDTRVVAGDVEVGGENYELRTTAGVVEGGGLPDLAYRDVFPSAPKGGPVLLPRVFVGRSIGGTFTLTAVGTPGLSDGVVLSRASWKLSSWQGGVQ